MRNVKGNERQFFYGLSDGLFFNQNLKNLKYLMVHVVLENQTNYALIFFFFFTQ